MKRYDFGESEWYEWSDGEWVRFEDHEAEIAAAVALIRVLVAYGHQPLPEMLVKRASAFLEPYPFEQSEVQK